jgi:regulator of replication initiation timing
MGIITDILKEIPLSAVLRERLVDKETKMAALDKENVTLKAKDTILQTENATFKTENANLRVDLQNAKKEIQRLTQMLNNPKPKTPKIEIESDWPPPPANII